MDKQDLYRLDLSDAEWRKSGYSNGTEQCVEVASLPGGAVAMRDSDYPAGPVLRFTAGEWDAFVRGTKDGEFDAA
ncbi:DUF397 domain-containing protein [Mangrovactinospora gilvigrisea]|uniref:DUF397 domain-containing protein n=1 Tax=Mangrovactinospora gilvigrisea TaxID=1428644 RepID=A0A1J7C948_9ACTN|nr:DUF397 domain-containing protein [Mangrovactinospora gilvigrisea]OIV38064.1 DUF397 domain-containing protein [Mangrovactinospora gilvigrisea]